MKKQLLMLVTCIIAAVGGMFPEPAACFEFITTTETIIVKGTEIDIHKTADNFIILYDTSSSMNEPYKNTGMKMIEVEKQILEDQHAKFPDLDYNAGLYSISPSATSMSMAALQPYYEMGPYNREAFSKAIDRLPTKGSGPTLLQQGLIELEKILSGLDGHTIVFVVTDGEYVHSKNMKKPVEIARNIAKKYDVCFYVISTAKKEKEKKLLEAVASINECSRVISFHEMLGRPEYITGPLYVIEEKLVEQPVQIEILLGIKLDDIPFHYNDYAIQSKYRKKLDIVGAYLEENPETYVIFAGFADSSGAADYNMGLSRQRAEAAESYLRTRFSIKAEQVVTLWYGEAHPVAGNDTKQGRSQNRRVEIIMGKS
jgi:OOP family OmpA-OmpF porin